ncbi:MAG TPA: flavin reductase family protein [Thermoleophilia bacterium]|nr:flavin reductase family protein [Thermoleophilia bacterium]
MAKKNIGRAFDIYPMPVVMIGTVVDDKPNFMTAAWITKLNTTPPLVGLSLGHGQHTAKGIKQTGEFSVNFPSVEQAVLADYCGLVHGYAEDKSAHIDIFRGALKAAPMVRQCPLTAECRLTQIVELPKDFLFIGEVMSVYASEAILTDGHVDPVKLRPFVLTMPGNDYWALGERIGDAWSIGKALVKPAEGPRTT